MFFYCIHCILYPLELCSSRPKSSGVQQRTVLEYLILSESDVEHPFREGLIDIR